MKKKTDRTWFLFVYLHFC